ncbi:MAG: zinc-ribbon domain-containing protein [Candidatus Omnitrophica bacterium]|nr:zinc-ribbon domain-containing protein [Candidatus Omnitrophota bacterium]
MDEEYFDFKEFEESEECLDFENTKNCPHCGSRIPENSLLCLYCGQGAKKGSSPAWIKITAVVLIFIFVLFAFYLLIGYI